MARGQWTILFLVLAAFLGQINSNVYIKVWFDDHSVGYLTNISFTPDQFEEFQQCLSDGINVRCDAEHEVNTPPYNVTKITSLKSPSAHISSSYVFQCSHNPNTYTLECERHQADLLDHLCNNTYRHQFFRVNNSECFALAWKHDKERFYSSLDTVRDCDGCTETTTPTTITSTGSTTSATTTTTTTTITSTSSTTSTLSAVTSTRTPSMISATSLTQPDDEGDNTEMIIGIIAGVLAVLLLIIGTIVLYKGIQAKPRVAPMESQPNVNKPPAE